MRRNLSLLLQILVFFPILACPLPGQALPIAADITFSQLLDSGPDRFAPYQDSDRSYLLGFHNGAAARYYVGTGFSRFFGADQNGSIAYSLPLSNRPGDNLYVASLSPGTGTPTQLLAHEKIAGAAWRPRHSGQLAVILQHGFDFDLYTYSVSTNLLALVALGANPTLLRWSDDGESLYYCLGTLPNEKHTSEIPLLRYTVGASSDFVADVGLIEAALVPTDQLSNGLKQYLRNSTNQRVLDFSFWPSARIRFSSIREQLLIKVFSQQEIQILSNTIPIAELPDGLVAKRLIGSNWQILAINPLSGAVSILLEQAAPPTSLIPWPSTLAEILLTDSGCGTKLAVSSAESNSVVASTLEGTVVYVRSQDSCSGGVKSDTVFLFSANGSYRQYLDPPASSGPVSPGMYSLRPRVSSSAATFPVGSAPFGVAFDGAHIWVTNEQGGTVTELLPSNGSILGTFPVGVNPQGIVSDGMDIWVANFTSNNVTRLRAFDGATLATITVGTNPEAVAFDGTNIWVTNNFSATVTKIRASDGSVLATFPVSNPVDNNALPQGVLYEAATGSIWIANYGEESVVKIRPSDGTVLQTIQLGAPGLCGQAGKPACVLPYALAFDGSNVWVTEKGTNSIAKIRASDGTLLGTFSAGSGPTWVTFDGTNLWVVDNSGDTLTKIRSADGTNLATVPVGGSPLGIASDGANLWVANSLDNTVSRVPVGPILALQNQQNNGVSEWFMGGTNNAAIESAPWFATAVSGWQLCAAADMDGDGVLDLIFQNASTGGVSIWYMTGVNGLIIGSAPIIYTAAPNWLVVAAADMNGDGVPDLILQNTVTNQISVWFLNPGGRSFSSAPIVATAAAGWKVVATGDINRDGVPDWLLQNQTTGQVSVWFMNPGGLSYSSAPIVAAPAAGWSLVATSDFNADGVPDYVLQNHGTGGVSVWYMTGTQGITYSSAPIIGTAVPGWYVLAGQ